MYDGGVASFKEQEGWEVLSWPPSENASVTKGDGGQGLKNLALPEFLSAKCSCKQPNQPTPRLTEWEIRENQ